MTKYRCVIRIPEIDKRFVYTNSITFVFDFLIKNKFIVCIEQNLGQDKTPSDTFLYSCWFRFILLLLFDPIYNCDNRDIPSD